MSEAIPVLFLYAEIGSMSHFSPDDPDNDVAFFRFEDLKNRNIVHDRSDLHRKQKLGFPKTRKFSDSLGAVALFPKDEVLDWVRANLREVDSRQLSATVVAKGGKPRGRPRKNTEIEAA